MSDPRMSGFMHKYGAHRATDAGPECPRCHRPIGRRDPAAEIAPTPPALFGQIIHASCASSEEYASGRVERVDDGGYGPSRVPRSALMLALALACFASLGPLATGNASARTPAWDSTSPVACQAHAMWEDGSSVCQFGAAMWSYDPDTSSYSVIDAPTVYLRALVPVHGR